MVLVDDGKPVTPHPHLYDVVVETPRSIAVPAGTFSVIPIVVSMHADAPHHYGFQSTYYYAPELATNVKYDLRVTSGRGRRLGPPWELVSITLPAPQ
jgi:hypothetical protein